MKSLKVEPSREWYVWVREVDGRVRKAWWSPRVYIGSTGTLQRGCTCGLGLHGLTVGSRCGFCGAVVVRVRCEESTGGVREWVA